jgi:tetratricopeptide (TPR) repeat protein
MANALERIGQLFIRKNQLNDALMCYKAAHERKATALARAHPAVAHSLACMAAIHDKRGDYRAAATMHARALEVRRAVLPQTSLELASSLFGLGNAQQRLRASKSALLAYEEAEAIRRININTHGKKGGSLVGLGDCLVNMSRPLKALGREDEAVAKLRDAGEVYYAAGLLKMDVRVQTVIANLRVLGAYNSRGSSSGSQHEGGGMMPTPARGGSRPTTPKPVLVNRQGVLMHHARSTTNLSSPSPSQRLPQQPLPVKSQSFPTLSPRAAPMKSNVVDGGSRPREVGAGAAGQSQQQCSIM